VLRLMRLGMRTYVVRLKASQYTVTFSSNGTFQLSGTENDAELNTENHELTLCADRIEHIKGIIEHIKGILDEN